MVLAEASLLAILTKAYMQYVKPFWILQTTTATPHRVPPSQYFKNRIASHVPPTFLTHRMMKDNIFGVVCYIAVLIDHLITIWLPFALRQDQQRNNLYLSDGENFDRLI